MPSLVIKEKSYKSCYLETLKMAEEIRSKICVGVFVTVGPYPVDFLKLKEKFGRNVAIQIMKKGMDEAAKLCEEKQCIGIGEIGRPHFPVEDQVIEDSNSILQYGMQKAKDVGVPIVVHTESTTPEQCQELANMGKNVGLSAEKIVKHFAPPLIAFEENYGVMPSILASEKNIIESLTKGSRFMTETDYIDDPKRPGAVLGPKTVPKLTKKLLDRGILDKNRAVEIHIENPKKIYNIALE
jgi:TatD-related deoxyribonuclease